VKPLSLRDATGIAIDRLDAEDHRYIIGKEIGRGAMGRVLEAYDRDLGRKVAFKVTHPARSQEEGVLPFIEEAQATSQLEHPNIVPVYDIGVAEDGRVYYVMKLVRGRSLKEVLFAIRNTATERNEFGRVRLLALFQQVCMGIDFAHAKGVIHRDLKPANIMVGDYGEIQIMDWGLATIVRRDSPMVGSASGRLGRREAESAETERSVSGTPLYMAPEQVRGDVAAIDERTDVYCLGVILYELLTWTTPFTARDVNELFEKVEFEPPAPPSERVKAARLGIDEAIPPDLDAIALKALAKNPADRFQRVREMHAEIALFLEGTRIRERNRAEAESRVDAGERAARRYFQLRAAERKLGDRVERLRRTTPTGGSVELRRSLWHAEDLSRTARTRGAAFFSNAIDQFTQALGFEPRNNDARLGCAKLYWDRFSEAERVRDLEMVIFCESAVRRLAEEEYRERLEGEGHLTVETWPSTARVSIALCVEKDRRIIAESWHELGTTPQSRVAIAMGRFLLRMDANGATVFYPLLVGRCEDVRLRIRIPSPGDVEPGFIFIPKGPCRVGGDPLAFNSPPARTVDVADFAMARFPVTCAAYLEFLNDTVAHDAEEAERHVPRVQPTAGFIWERGADGRFHLPTSDAEGDSWLPEMPVLGVSWEDATAFAAWKSRGAGRRFRLATRDEWEKAGRGVDGRLFPWGDSFDAAFCHIGNTWPGRPEVKPVGTVATDESPYGVRDLSGGIREYCDGWVDEAAGLRPLRGGYWAGAENIARLACVGYRRAYETSTDAGFRLAHDLPPPSQVE
jgi:serine/threonine-protein kinase